MFSQDSRRLAYLAGCLVALLGLLVTPTVESAAAPKSSVKVFLPEHTLSIFPSTDAWGGPRLSLNASDTGLPEYHPPETTGPAGLASGVANTQAGVVDDDHPQVFEFTNASLPQTYYLNVSKPIHGVLYWSSTFSQTQNGPAADEHGVLRLELFHGDVRVGGSQDESEDGLLPVETYIKWGQEHAKDFVCFDACPVPKGPPLDPIVDYAIGERPIWIPFHFSFRAEINTLEQGKPLTVRVTRLSGTADLAFGTGGDQRSFLDLSYFESDPLRTIGYLDNHHLALSPPDENETDPSPTESESSSYLWMGAGAVPGLLLAPTRGRRSRAALLVVALLSLIALSGCLGGAPGGQDTLGGLEGSGPEPSELIEQGFECRKDLEKQGLGAIEGSVRSHEEDLPIGDALVGLGGTTFSTTSDDRGEFRFGQISWKGLETQRDFLVYFEAEGFLDVEHTVTVKRGCATILKIELVRVPLDSAYYPHRHDVFGKREVLQLAGPQEVLPEGFFGLRPDENRWLCPAWNDAINIDPYCETTLPIQFDKEPGVAMIPPGTARVELRLEWSPDPQGKTPKELGLSIKTAGSTTSAGEILVPRPSGQSFGLAIFPHEADASHQSSTAWVFNLRVPASYLYTMPYSPPVYTGGAIRILGLWAHKGVVPFEPAHPDFWKGRSELPLLEEKWLNITTVNLHDHPHKQVAWSLGQINATLFVPPGTKELRGAFEWIYDSPYAPAIEWGLVYKAANVPEYDWKAGLKSVTLEGSTARRTFTIPVLVEEADQAYQSRSYWTFYPDDGAPPDHDEFGHHAVWGVKWRLTLTAIRDPAWQDTAA